jgi:hypothetical protein
VAVDAGLLEVAEFALGEALFFLSAEAELNGVLAVGLEGLDLHHRAGTCFDDRDRNDGVFAVVYLGHPDFFAEEGGYHDAKR